MWKPREDPGQSPQGHLGLVCPAPWQSSLFLWRWWEHPNPAAGFPGSQSRCSRQNDTSTITEIYLWSSPTAGFGWQSLDSWIRSIKSTLYLSSNSIPDWELTFLVFRGFLTMHPYTYLFLCSLIPEMLAPLFHSFAGTTEAHTSLFFLRIIESQNGLVSKGS